MLGAGGPAFRCGVFQGTEPSMFLPGCQSEGWDSGLCFLHLIFKVLTCSAQESEDTKIQGHIWKCWMAFRSEYSVAKYGESLLPIFPGRKLTWWTFSWGEECNRRIFQQGRIKQMDEACVSQVPDDRSYPDNCSGTYSQVPSNVGRICISRVGPERL